MPQASGVYKQLAFKRESTYGTAPGASGAQLLRRVTSDISQGLQLRVGLAQQVDLHARSDRVRGG